VRLFEAAGFSNRDNLGVGGGVGEERDAVDTFGDEGLAADVDGAERSAEAVADFRGREFDGAAEEGVGGGAGEWRGADAGAGLEAGLNREVVPRSLKPLGLGANQRAHVAERAVGGGHLDDAGARGGGAGW